MRTERAELLRHAVVAKATDYMLKRWDGFACFLDDGRICLTHNAAERALRPLCLARKSWLFCGSDGGGERAAVMYTLIARPSSTVSPRRFGWPTSLTASASSRRPDCTSSSLGAERPNRSRPCRVAGTLHSRLTGRPAPARTCQIERGLHRMLTALSPLSV